MDGLFERSILIVDDEAINREILGTIIQSEYKVIYAENGKEALENSEHLYQLEIGILDNTYTQLRNAAYQVLLGNQTVDQAIASYGKY